MFKRHFIKELSSYLDNQLAEKEKLRVEAHLKDCEFCQKELSRLRLLSEKLQAWQVPQPGPFFAAAVKGEIAHQGAERGASKMKFKKWYIAVPSGVLVGCLVLAFVGNYFGRSIRGRLKTSPDYIGKQFDPTTGYKNGWLIQGQALGGGAVTRETRDALTGAIVTGGFYNLFGTNREYPENGAGAGWLGRSYASSKRPRDANQNLPVTALGGGSLQGSAYQNFAGGSYEPYYISKGTYNMNKDGAERGIQDEWSGRRELALGNALNGNIAFKGGAIGGAYAQAEPQIPSPVGAPVIVIQPVLPATGIGDKIIRFAEVQLEVEDAGRTYTKVSTICQELGGYLAASNFHKDQEGRQAGTITMRIPKEKFLDALNKINALGKVENSSTQSQDVSQEYANLKNQLETAMIVYNKMMEALQKRQVTIPEAMRLESELSPILRRVESLKNRIDYLNNAISFTTITVHFREPKVSLKVLKDSKQDIQKSMLAATIGAIQFLARAIPATIAVVIWLAIVLAIVVVLKNWVTRLFKRQ